MTFDKVRDVIVDTISCDAEDVTPEATLADDLGADSLDAVELNMAFEEAFDITIPDDDMASFKTVGDIVTYIENHQ